MPENLSIGDVIPKTVSYFAGHGISNPRLEADLLLAKVLNLPRVRLYSAWDRVLTPAELQQYRELIAKRVQGWPNAYLVGKRAFLSWDFSVTPAVLVPRPETEILVEAVYDRVKSRQVVSGVDVGTGSGIIAITLAKLLPQSTWIALDISPEALEVARVNAKNLGVESRITFRCGDLLEPYLSEQMHFDLILANPPYIPTGDLPSLAPEVQKEPRQALDGGPDGLEVYRRLLPQAATLLNKDGFIAVEHGFDQREPLEKLFRQEGLTPSPLRDLSGMDRVLIGQFSVERSIDNNA